MSSATFSSARARSWMWVLAAAGAAALADQVVWARAAAAATGSSAGAAAVVLASLLGGMSHGAAHLGRRVDDSAQPARLFARLEFGLALAAIFLPWWLAVGLPGLVNALPWPVRLGATGASLWPAAFLMGGTLSASLRSLGGGADRRRWIAWAQAANGGGAALGGGLAALFGMEHLGVLGLGAVAAAVHAGTGWWAWTIAARGEQIDDEVQAAKTGAETLEPLTPGVLRAVVFALFLSGVGALLLETAALRTIGLTFGGSAHAYGTMVAAFVLGLSLGSALLGWWRPARPLVALGATQALVCVTVLVLTPALARLPLWAGQLRASTAPSGDYAGFLLGGFALGGGVWLLPTLFLGAAFPLTAVLLSAGQAKVGKPVGGALSANALGNVVGALLGTFVLLGWVGLRGTLEFGLLLHALAALICLGVAGSAGRRSLVGWGVVVNISLVAYAGLGRGWSEPLTRGVLHLRVRSDAPESLEEWQAKYVDRAETVVLEEDAHLVVHVTDLAGQRALFLNAKPDASTGHDLPTQVLVGHLPLLFAPDPQRVLMVGYGAGFSAGAVLRHPIEHLDVLEISPAVLKAHESFAPFNGNALADPRVRAHEIDASAFLAGSDERWDAIVCQPSNPWLVGVADLYTPALLTDLREHLAPGGVAAVWFHEYEQSERVIDRMLAALEEVFGRAELFRVHELDDVIALAWNGDPPPLDERLARLDRAFRNSDVRDSLGQSQISTPVDLLSLHVGWPLDHGLELQAGPHTRLAPKLEYEAARAFFLGKNSQRLRAGDPLLGTPQQTTWLDDYAQRAERLGDPLTRLDWGDAIARRLWASIDEGADPTRGWKQRALEAPELNALGGSGRLPAREFQRARDLEGEQRFEAALGAYRGGLSWAQDDIEGRHGAARCLLKLERFEEAESLLASLVQDVPSQPMLHLDHGKALNELGRIGETRASWQEAYKGLDRSDVAFEIALWELSLNQPDTGNAERLLNRVLGEHPDHIEAIVALCELFVEHKGQPDQARILLRSALSRNPGQRALIEALARVE